MISGAVAADVADVADLSNESLLLTLSLLPVSVMDDIIFNRIDIA